MILFFGQSAISPQPDNSQLAVDILRSISQQLAHQRTTAVAPDMPQPFRSSGFDVILNSLLDASFLTSVITSAMTLWAKQWLRKYTLDESASSHDRALVRLHRYDVLRRWDIRAIVASISILLQVSVLLFSVGVVMLAYKADTALAAVLFGLNAAWWATTWVAALWGPTFAPTCPFKSPLSRAIFRVAYYFRRTLRLRSPGSGLERWSVGKFRTLEERELDEITRHRSTQSKLELKALTLANEEFRGSQRLKAINECFREVEEKEEALKCIERILRKHHGVRPGISRPNAPEVSEEESGMREQDEGIKQLIAIGREILVGLVKMNQENREELRAKYRIFDVIPRKGDHCQPLAGRTASSQMAQHACQAHPR